MSGEGRGQTGEETAQILLDQLQEAQYECEDAYLAGLLTETRDFVARHVTCPRTADAASSQS